MRETWILVIISILFAIGTKIMFTLLRCTILMLWISRKSFSFHHFPCNESLSMKCNKLRYSEQSPFFSLWELQPCSPHCDTWYWCFGFARQVFCHHFPYNKVHSWNETNLDTHNNSILFVIGTTIMFSKLEYMTLMLWICKKSFSFHYFPYNQSSFVKWAKLGCS